MVPAFTPVANLVSELPPVTLVLGGARSGKSAWAESLIEQQMGDVWEGAIYLATATAADTEMAARILEHRERRGPQWQTVEEPLQIAGALKKFADPMRPVLVDCLTLWLSNLMLNEQDVTSELSELENHLNDLAGPVVFVSNEVGLSIVPDNALARAFRDHAGRLNQQLAARADFVVFITAGLPITLKSP
jgi:adenosylcobinamide kinase / adenosylcobinamide-phosphate guanylyltransferase